MKMSFQPIPVSSLNIEYLLTMTDLSKQYHIEEVLGWGSYGICYRVIDLINNKVKAIKITLKRKTGDKNENYNEIRILKSIVHPNIIQVDKGFESKSRFSLVMEYCPKQLFNILKERKKLLENEVHNVMRYLISAVAYLHLNGIVHRDLKIENILLTTNPDDLNDEWFIKLIDFESCTFQKRENIETSDNNICQKETKVLLYTDQICGTIQYIAPELFGKSYSQKCDIWSMGVIMYLLLQGNYPFVVNPDDIENVRDLIINSTINYEAISCSQQGIELIQQCLIINPVMRIAAGEMLNDPWILGDPNKTTPKNITNIIVLMEEFNKNTKTGDTSITASYCTINNETEITGETRSDIKLRDPADCVVLDENLQSTLDLTENDNTDSPTIIVSSSKRNQKDCRNLLYFRK